jgi:glutathione S-transferase
MLLRRERFEGTPVASAAGSNSKAMKLFDSPFSPFARKVWMALRFKGLPFEAVDGLLPENRRALVEVNSRVEVPVLVDGDVVVVNSADIVAYLDHRYPERPLLPADPKRRVAARAWERLADVQLDSIFHDVSIWTWPIVDRTDTMPPGLFDAAKSELEEIYGRLESALAANGDFVCGEMTIADLALYPHLLAAKPLGIPFTHDRFPKLDDWLRRMRACPLGAEDLKRAREWLQTAARTHLKVDKIVWRGDRIEWLLAHGGQEWFAEEIRSGRVAWPKP